MSLKNLDMRSKYKKIGSLIQLVDERNKALEVETLLGVSINKVFIESVANTVGTNMANYKIIRQGQFAVSLMQVRRDKKIPIALYRQEEPSLVSQAYPVFEVLDHEELLPEYLMMWVSRSEFDRETCFHAVGGVRGSLEWEDFCNLELPLPSIEKQREIVREYEVITDRIALNEKMSLKLEETAQALYKHWFVDFEFPMSSDYTVSIGKPELTGKPYKTNGGEMKYSVELDCEIPIYWNGDTYEKRLRFRTGKLNSNAAIENGDYPFFTCSQETFLTNSYSFDEEAVILAGNNASAVYPLKYFKGKFDAYQRTYIITSECPSISIFHIYFSIKSQLENFKGTSSGTATKFLTMKIFNPLGITVPDKISANVYKGMSDVLFDKLFAVNLQTSLLKRAGHLILSNLSNT